LSKLNRFLEGVKVVDLSRHLPGPLATLLMADMGAEVLKIEPPGGEELRFIGPKGEDGLSLYYLAVNAGKTAAELDLRSEKGRERLLAYVDEADVLVESFRPGVMQRLGVGYETLKARKPDLIYCGMSGFGQSGPHALRAGHDMNYLALNGVLSLAAGSAPPYPPPADASAAQMAVISLLGALRHRDRTGEGSQIDLALADAPLPLATFDLAEVSVNPELGGGEGVISGAAAYCQIYETSDGGRITLCPIEPKFWKAFCDAAQRPDWLERHSDPLPQEDLRGEIAAYFASLTLEEAVARFEPADCCFAPVLSLSDALGSPQVTARGLVRRGLDNVWQALFPALVDGEAPRTRKALRKL
jgi:crotonobetainyl-CoA:carnitine CoA-transferase CaiB-like acyl-CoA transferase